MQGTGTTKREGEVPMVVLKLSATVESLGKTLERLETRLAQVSRNELNGEGAEKSVNPEFVSLLAQNINSNVRTLYELENAVNRMIDRLEI